MTPAPKPAFQPRVAISHPRSGLSIVMDEPTTLLLCTEPSSPGVNVFAIQSIASVKGGYVLRLVGTNGRARHASQPSAALTRAGTSWRLSFSNATLGPTPLPLFGTYVLPVEDVDMDPKERRLVLTIPDTGLPKPLHKNMPKKSERKTAPAVATTRVVITLAGRDRVYLVPTERAVNAALDWEQAGYGEAPR